MLAGPSEVLVIADQTADTQTIAADLLAQVSRLLVSIHLVSSLLDLTGHTYIHPSPRIYTHT